MKILLTFALGITYAAYLLERNDRRNLENYLIEKLA